MNKTLARILIVLALVLGTGALAVNAVSAQKDGDTRPGWGYGDKNHTHTGPPGESTRPDTEHED